ncbi:hypothetical protein GTZ99_12500 [Novosphingobium sp. FSY-8]|uniref:Uncharacterized protein n=1 Tax=Novosphingobium ovatum TaxID=1908523 RepID=A0ABW9XFQ5_9SPHN|nr:hypothetical protein [Novosphingobium ovatum]NBC37371.1 hypothetical protein [Novosphingobium ovatum]
MLVFPTYAFSFSGMNADIERRVTSGGTSLSGQEDVVSTDGGGRFAVEFSAPYLDEIAIARAWRAWSAELAGGVTAVIVPIADLRHQFNQDIRVPTTLPFWTEAEAISTDTGVTLAADAALRATTLDLAIAYLPGPMEAGMWLSIDHATMRHRAYRIARVVSQTATTASVTLSHPLREAATAGDPVEMIDPRCVCRLDGDMTSPSEIGFTSSDKVRFVEDFRGSYT